MYIQVPEVLSPVVGAIYMSLYIYVYLYLCIMYTYIYTGARGLVAGCGGHLQSVDEMC